MKLAAHYNRTNILITVTLLIIGAAIYFFAINYIARKQLDRDLSEEIEEVEDYVNTNNKLPKQVDFDEDQTVFTKTDQKNLETRFFDTTYINPKEKKAEPGRAIESIIRLNGSDYKVIISVSRESTEYLLQFVGVITLSLMAGLLLILFLANRYFLNGLWKPFYDLLQQIKLFNISEEKNFKLSGGQVSEFIELSAAVESMSARVRNDYRNLKDLTDNASHEMLTPLAVITSKLDILIQNETLPLEIYEQIEDIYAATGKLSRLNQTLLLLTKIENNMINGSETIDLSVLLADKIKQFNELILAKRISVNERLSAKDVFASKYLIDILLNNLISNAIWHNKDDGELVIILNERELIFQNTGTPVALNKDTIFERFKKDSKSEGTGLGLTLVENICKFYAWEINYDFKDELHSFKINF